MDTTLKFAHEEDVICAMELVYEHEIRNMLISNIFGLNKALSFINFACINDTDNVITIGSHLEITTLLISYIYAPQKLVTQISDTNCGINNGLLKNINELLSGYKYTEIISSNFDIGLIEYEKESFDVAIVGFVNLINISEEVQINRFSLESGIEYEMFEKLLAKSSKLLKKDGRLIVLTKPGWILKLWSLIHDLGLQLEYDSYSLYIDSNRHPNEFIWLRFIKRDVNVNLELHKRNILSLMNDNNIDRLYAHRNNLIFPYVEPSYSNSEAYVKLNQNLEYMQYFFSVETTANLGELCEGYTACLVTPSVARYAYKTNKNIVLFERDNRFRENGGLKFVKYDLNIGLTKFLQNKYLKKFDRVICDPPFDIKLDVLANDIVELLKQDRKSVVYIIFPNNRKISLINSMKARGLLLEEETQKISIEYARPPKIVRVNGKDAIQLYKFTYVI
ncbi:hypothetical protein [uncultured Clostridium sp.]|uniref:hypothetical protein n=1 Tax=uncultured Clostridium sp. TaxID=59620 RepID=UPI003216646E